VKGHVVAIFSGDDPDAGDNIRNMFGPKQIDQLIRQAISTCWMILPDDRKNVDEVEKQVRRLVDRALRDLREDSESFGF
tara:strand:+ start:859 stop:1095 length:237 start_codon:yes stop_codon:yes gene_type:complete